jgi:Arc/MetJ-type ribon-helix-helix transcriptional regulator
VLAYNDGINYNHIVEVKIMGRTKSIKNSVKYTVVLPESSIRELKELVDDNKITSVNAGVREAIEEYLINLKAKDYRDRLKEAIKDPDFIKRNEDTMKSFRYSDKETEEMITEW